MSNSEVLKKRKKEKIEKVLNHSIPGEGYILTPARTWKLIVLYYFNKVHRQELSVDNLLRLLKEHGVQFGQKDSLVRYPVQECLRYIAKISGKTM